MKVSNTELIKDLTNSLNTINQDLDELLKYTDEALNKKSSPESWSALECIEHLNLYNEFYIPEIELRIKEAQNTVGTTFKSGWIGNYFAKSMLPKKKLNKMKTFADKNPIGSQLNRNVITKLIADNQKLLALIDDSKNMDLTKTKTAITISKILKLRIGDTFRFLINHQIRHIEQAKNCL